MLSLPEPRRYGSTETPRHATSHELLAADDAIAIDAWLAAAPSASDYRERWNTLARAAEQPPATAASDATTRYFALPLIIVAGARAAGEMAGTLPAIEEVQALLTELGAVGPTRAFGLSNALVAPEALAAVHPLDVYRVACLGRPLADLPPAPAIHWRTAAKPRICGFL